MWFNISRRATTRVSGGVWQGFSQPQQIQLRRPLRHYLWPWEVWVFRMFLVSVSRLSGQAGSIFSPCFGKDTHKWLWNSLHAASKGARELTGVEGPTWDALANFLRPPTHDADEFEPGAKRGWQHEAASRGERQFRTRLMERLAEHEQASHQSQSGPMAGMALTATRIDSHLFRLILSRRVRLPLAPGLPPTCCWETWVWPCQLPGVDAD